MSTTCQMVCHASLDRMPCNIFTLIVIPRLNEKTSTERILDEADIPVIMGEIRNLSLTCKNVYKIVNCQAFTQMLLENMTKKYKKSQAYMASMLDTPGARQWLWTYINQNGYKEVYDTIQDIYALAARILTEAKKAGLDFNAEDGRMGWSFPKPLYSRVQTGLFLFARSTPNGLATPFGEMIIYPTVGVGSDCLAITEMFIRRLNATFAKILYSEKSFPSKQNNNRLILVSDHKSNSFSNISYNAGKAITKADLERQKGKKVVVVNSHAETMYTIQRVGSRALLVGTWPSSKCEHEAVKMMWEMLKKNEHGLNPLMKVQTTMRINLSFVVLPVDALTHSGAATNSNYMEIMSERAKMVQTVAQKAYDITCRDRFGQKTITQYEYSARTASGLRYFFAQPECVLLQQGKSVLNVRRHSTSVGKPIHVPEDYLTNPIYRTPHPLPVDTSKSVKPEVAPPLSVITATNFRVGREKRRSESCIIL